MNTLTIVCGLSCTFKTTIMNNLEKLGFIQFPDVNREYINSLKSVVTDESRVDTTGKIDTLMLVANRINVYNMLTNIASQNSSPRGTINYITGRTIVEHLFFDNSSWTDLEVNHEKLVEAEAKIYSKYDKVNIVIVQNECLEMLQRFYLTDKIRTSITSKEDKLKAYLDMQPRYIHFIKQMAKLLGDNVRIFEYTIPETFSVDKIQEYSTNLSIKVFEDITGMCVPAGVLLEDLSEHNRKL